MTYPKKPHPHADIMKACADDMNLSVFIKAEKWEMALYPSFHPELHYFACLPKHEEAVLNMLNGGEVQVKTAVDWAEWLNVAETEEQQPWYPEGWYMCDEWESRIKPETQKRWIAIRGNITSNLYHSREEVLEVYGGDFDGQFIEIEVEV